MRAPDEYFKTARLLVLLAMSGTACADEITDRVRAAMTAAAPELHTKLLADGGIEVSGPNGQMTMYTDNVRQQCSGYPDLCDDQIKTYVSAIATLVKEGASSLTLSESNVYPVIRSGAALNGLSEAMHKAPEKTPIARAFTSDSVVLYAIDSPKAIRFATPKDLEHQGLTQERLETLAVANARRLDPVKISTFEEGVFAVVTKDGYATSRLFDPGFPEALERAAGGPVVVAVPTRDWIIAAKAGDAPTLARLKDLAGRMFRGEAYAVTPKLVTWDGKNWQEVP